MRRLLAPVLRWLDRRIDARIEVRRPIIVVGDQSDASAADPMRACDASLIVTARLTAADILARRDLADRFTRWEDR